jgi:hypothetical protein
MSYDIKEILSELGYTLLDMGKEYRARPLYRDSSSNSVLCIKKDTGRWIDYKDQRYGRFEELVQITLNLKDISEAKQYLVKEFHFVAPKPEKEKLKGPKIFGNENLKQIIPVYSYWAKRGVSPDTLKLLESGVMTSGKLEGRYVFPIFDKINRLVGAAGRDITNKSQMKWKLVGEKRLWVYPLKYNRKYFTKNGSVVLVESIGDMLALWETGIRNVIVTFGLFISPKIKQTLMIINPQKIYIAFNNDTNQAGSEGATKAHYNLTRQFDAQQVEIALPTKNDFGSMTKEEILEWKSQIKM